MVDGLMCYAGWDKFKGNCYRRSPSGPATYSAAQAACKGLQANLLIIENQEEMDYLAGEHYSGIEKTTSSRMYSTAAMLCLWWLDSTFLTASNFWIGLDDLKTTGTYVWNDGKPINAYSPTNWATNEPNGDQENCVEVFFCFF